MEAKIAREPVYGYLHLDPIPSQAELDQYYRDEYFEQVKKGDRAPTMRQQLVGGSEAALDLDWLNKTLYADIADVLSKHTWRGNRLLDVGSGTGAFLLYAASQGWNAVGVEPSTGDVPMPTGSEKVPVHHMTLAEFARFQPSPFDAITLLNVLEHVPDPFATLVAVKKLLRVQDGVLCIRVPNDFSSLQERVVAALGVRRWWITSPDHVNYFDFASLRSLLEVVGLEIVYETTDFPMELFLLAGDNYVDNPEVGAECHKMRRNFELAIPAEMRRRIYCKLAKNGVGRSCIVFAKAKTGAGK